MVDYNGASRNFEYSSGIELRELNANGEHLPATVAFVDMDLMRPSRDGQFDFVHQTVIQFVNRGKNTGAGPAFVYWLSPEAPDPAGYYYNGAVPFGQLTDIVGVGTFLA